MSKEKRISYVGPGKYVQGCGIVDELSEYTAQYGKKPFVLVDIFFKDIYSEKIKEGYIQNGSECILKYFGGENNHKEVEKCCCEAGKYNADYIIALGGGKTLDCGKYVAHRMRLPFVSIPTTASTDAPCSALTIVYDGADNERKVIRCAHNPDLVLVDSQIIADAPVRFLRAGIGDALATYFEAMANERTGTANFIGENCIRTRLSVSIAETCYDVLKQYALQAVQDAKKHEVTQALEYIIEANILLSGLGFENTGCAGAHSISSGIGAVEVCRGILHGERVAFGTLCQVYLERLGEAVLKDLFRFCRELKLPVTLEDLGITDEKEKTAKRIAEASMDKFWDAEPVKVSVAEIQKAILAVDEMGSETKKNYP